MSDRALTDAELIALEKWAGRETGAEAWERQSTARITLRVIAEVRRLRIMVGEGDDKQRLEEALRVAKANFDAMDLAMRASIKEKTEKSEIIFAYSSLPEWPAYERAKITLRNAENALVDYKLKSSRR